MRPLIAILSFLAILGMGVWAYRENYATQQVLREVDYLNREIAALRIAVGDLATRDYVRAELRSLLEELQAEPESEDEPEGR